LCDRINEYRYRFWEIRIRRCVDVTGLDGALSDLLHGEDTLTPEMAFRIETPFGPAIYKCGSPIRL
jgi:hypothetical protein